jgi:hypothetical protein
MAISAEHAQGATHHASRSGTNWDRLAAPIVRSFALDTRRKAAPLAKLIVRADVAAAEAIWACQRHLGALEATLMKQPFGLTQEAARDVMGNIIDGELPAIIQIINDIRKD